MEYRGYSARVEYDEELDALHGQVLNINDVITFQGSSVDELKKEFEASVDDYLTWCEERGEEPDKPFSGKFLLRIEPETHRRAALAAAKSGDSLTQWVAGAIDRALAGDDGHDRLVAKIEDAVRTSVSKQTVIAVPDRGTAQSSLFFGKGPTRSSETRRATRRSVRKTVKTLGEWTNEWAES